MIHPITIPFRTEDEGISAKYLYVLGGHHSPDQGCPPWGTSDPADIRFIGDRLGTLVIRYADGSKSCVPLVLGYTMWLHNIWGQSLAPFLGEARDETLTKLLEDALCLYGAWENKDTGILRIALPDIPVVSVMVETNPEKHGTPVFVNGYITDAETIEESGEEAAAFFATHTVSCDDRVPVAVQKALDAIGRALHTFESDFDEAPLMFAYPQEPKGYKIHFSGSRVAEIATGVVYHNMENLVKRTDEDGFIHTSYQGAPTWWYEGFGPYVANAGNYWYSFYSRDGARAIMTLNGYGHTTEATAACGFGNRWMMVYPEKGLTIGGKPIPGHFSVIPNMPFIYSQCLTKLGVPALCDDPDAAEEMSGGWPTRYTKKRFGEEYENLGNQETDGHGLMMMGNYLVWCNLGKPAAYVQENWTYVNECAKWILWCFDNPDVSFVENDLLYGETEAAMNTYTLYANVPCYLGLMGYAEMAEAAGKEEEAALWRTYAARLRGGIDAGFTEDGKWNAQKFGFIHDPVLTMLADYYGYDITDMPSDWVERSRAVYEKDLENTVAHGWYGASGIGYNHSMITQNALLLDRMEDAGKLVESLSKLSYAPRLPDPYMVPEGLAVDVKKGVLRRQGDLGNLVQLAEAMKCYLLVMGISPLRENTLKIMPRLPRGWGMSVERFPVQNSKLSLSMTVSYPEGDRQTMTLDCEGERLDRDLQIRFGPFDTHKDEVTVTLNGTTYVLPLMQSGDKQWAWLKTTFHAL